MNVVNLTKQLINIPSFVDDKNNEQAIGEYISKYLQQFPWLQVEKQQIAKGRYNIVAKDKFPTRLLFTGHMDTVQPKSGWTTNQYKGIIKNGKLFGLGTADMKGNIAAMLCSLENFQSTKGLMLLFYVDEEYDFLGTKSFIKKYQKKIQPEYILSGDGNDLEIGNGCRGLIEISFITRGLSAHASRPDKGKNAITRSVYAINMFSKYIHTRYSDNLLGNSTCNLAFLQGGLSLGNSDEVVLGREGNNVADVAEFVLDVRPAKKELNAEKVISLLDMYLQKKGLQLQKSIIRHNIPPWITPKANLNEFEKIINSYIQIKYKNLGEYGYSDMQMLYEAFGNPTTITFGAGFGKLTHQANEYIKITDLKKLQSIYTNFLISLVDGIRKSL